MRPGTLPSAGRRRPASTSPPDFRRELTALALGSARARAYVAAGVLAFTVGVLGWHIAKGPEEFGGGPTPAEVSAIYTQLDMLPRGTGEPIASGQFGRLTVHVFDHDVARDLEAAPAPPRPPAP